MSVEVRIMPTGSYVFNISWNSSRVYRIEYCYLQEETESGNIQNEINTKEAWHRLQGQFLKHECCIHNFKQITDAKHQTSDEVWIVKQEHTLHKYNIKHAFSKNGVHIFMFFFILPIFCFALFCYISLMLTAFCLYTFKLNVGFCKITEIKK